MANQVAIGYCPSGYIRQSGLVSSNKGIQGACPGAKKGGFTESKAPMTGEIGKETMVLMVKTMIVIGAAGK